VEVVKWSPVEVVKWSPVEVVEWSPVEMEQALQLEKAVASAAVPGYLLASPQEAQARPASLQRVGYLQDVHGGRAPASVEDRPF